MSVLHSHHAGGERGPWSAFCHGLFGQGKNWTQVAKVVAERHRVLLLDMPQHGRSPWTPDFDYLDAADQVAQRSRRAVAVVGHSMGGKSLVLALLHPSASNGCAWSTWRRSPTRAPTPSTLRRCDARLDLHALGPAPTPTGARGRGADPVVRGFLLQNLRRHRSTRTAPGWYWQPNLEVIGDRLDVITGWPADRLADVTPYDGPVLWVRGERSDYVGDEHAEAMTALFPRVRRVTIKGSGHWVHSEQPEAFTSVMLAFVDAPATK